jgi:hypothetical protein
VRVCQVTGFVAVWALVGIVLRWSGLANDDRDYVYLLAGIPLVVLFQLLIRKKPLASLWRRDADRLRLRWPGILVACFFALVPALNFAAGILIKLQWSIELYFVAAIVGALGAAFCIQSTPLRDLKRGLPSFLVATTLGVAWMQYSAYAQGIGAYWNVPQIASFIEQLLLLFPVCFVVEEVAFRGLLDTHLHEVDPPGSRGWRSACIISILWALWHLPIVQLSGASWPSEVAMIGLIHLVIGVPLSFCWRTSGSLLLPALSHAIIDAYRNAAGLLEL